MARTVKEWVGKTDDETIPGRVRLRVFDRFEGRCAVCKLKVRLRVEYDHVVALVNGGRHAESNLQLLCGPCHKAKTKADVGEKKINNRVRSKHLGIKKRKGRPMPGSRDSGIKMLIGGGWKWRQ